jgi:hypothetical protein
VYIVGGGLHCVSKLENIAGETNVRGLIASKVF